MTWPLCLHPLCVCRWARPLLRRKLIYTGNDTGQLCCACNCRLLAVCIALQLLITTSSALSYIGLRVKKKSLLMSQRLRSSRSRCVFYQYTMCYVLYYVSQWNHPQELGACVPRPHCWQQCCRGWPCMCTCACVLNTCTLCVYSVSNHCACVYLSWWWSMFII